MTDVLLGITNQQVSDLASFIVYLVTGFVFLMGFIKCVVPVMNTRRVLRRAARQIKKGDASRRSWQEQTFLGKGALYPHWCEYLNNLFFADGEFHNPSAVEDYINEETVISGPGRSSFADAAPGIMVSLGFLGTLIGISMGLEGFSMDDADQVMRAIRQLVPGMQYAFMTSIVGVIGSISLTVLTRIVSGAAEGALHDFYAAMNQHAGVVSVEPMTQIAIYQQEQTALIQTMARDLSGAMADRIAEAVSGAVSRSMSGLQTSLDNFITHTTHEQLRGVDIIVKRFIQQMNASVDGQFEALKRTIDETCQNQRQIGEDIRKSIDGLMRVSQNTAAVAQLSDGLVAKLDDYVTKINRNASMVEEGYARIAGNVEHLEIIARQQNNYLQSASKLQSEVIKTLERFDTANEEFLSRLIDNTQSTALSLHEAGEALKQSSDTLATNHKILVGGVAKDIDRTFNTFFKATNETIDHLAWLIGDIKNTMARLPDALDSATGLYAHQSDRLNDALRRTQLALEEVVAHLNQSAYNNR